MNADSLFRRGPVIARLAVPTGLAALVLFGSARVALAQTTTVNCNDTTMFPNPIYMGGSSAFEPTAAQIAVKLAALATPYTLIYKATASCDGPADIRDALILTGSADHFVLNGTTVATQQCVLDPAGAAPITADVGIADVAYDACFPGSTVPAGMKDFPGPVQAMQFIVPKANTTVTAISADQAAAIWGCGTTSGVAPFTDETAIEQRNAQSGTQIMVSKYIGVSPDAMKGVMNGTGGNLVTSLLAVTNPQVAIGFLASDAYDSRRTTLNALAFKGFGQTKAYYADSDPAVHDKQNVRDGHYMIFGPEHFFAKVDGTGVAIGNAKKLIDWVQGTVAIDATKPYGYIDIEGLAGMVPQCAMKVSRDTDGGLLKPYKPAVSCGCYYQQVVTAVMPPPNCTPCQDSTSCTGGKTCQTGFCE
jgi:ABC-type phosphate transport system substrate-binding protein